MSHLNALAHRPGAFSNAFPKTTFQLQHDLWFSESDILFSKLIVLGSGTNRGSNISLCNSSWTGLYEGPVVCSNPVSENGRARLYQQSQEIMPARLELRAVWQTERALQKPSLQTRWIKILKRHENTFFFFFFIIKEAFVRPLATQCTADHNRSKDSIRILLFTVFNLLNSSKRTQRE